MTQEGRWPAPWASCPGLGGPTPKPSCRCLVALLWTCGDCRWTRSRGWTAPATSRRDGRLRGHDSGFAAAHGPQPEAGLRPARESLESALVPAHVAARLAWRRAVCEAVSRPRPLDGLRLQAVRSSRRSGRLWLDRSIEAVGFARPRRLDAPRHRNGKIFGWLGRHRRFRREQASCGPCLQLRPKRVCPCLPTVASTWDSRLCSFWRCRRSGCQGWHATGAP